ncbi:MAG: GatB/YqeY domain-containing protein [Chitinophagaceae bacterium]
MSLEQKIMAEMKTAMLTKNEPLLRGLRAIKAGILLARTAEGAKSELTPEEEIKILQKLSKQRKDSLEIFRQQNREDLALKEEQELEVIHRFLPQQMEEGELRENLLEIIRETGASSLADLGRVMGIASRKLAGRADGKSISGMVKQLLSP